MFLWLVAVLVSLGSAVLLGVRYADDLYWWWDGVLERLYEASLEIVQRSVWWQRHAIEKFKASEKGQDNRFLLIKYRSYLRLERYAAQRRRATRLIAYVERRVAELERGER